MREGGHEGGRSRGRKVMRESGSARLLLRESVYVYKTRIVMTCLHPCQSSMSTSQHWPVKPVLSPLPRRTRLSALHHCNSGVARLCSGHPPHPCHVPKRWWRCCSSSAPTCTCAIARARTPSTSRSRCAVHPVEPWLGVPDLGTGPGHWACVVTLRPAHAPY